jgi:hypothetical protein
MVNNMAFMSDLPVFIYYVTSGLHGFTYWKWCKIHLPVPYAWRGMKIDWLVIHCFKSRSRIYHTYRDVTIAREGLQSLGLRSALRDFKQGRIFICHTCCYKGPRFTLSHPKDRPIQLPLTTHNGMWRIYSNPDPHGLVWKRNQANAYYNLHFEHWEKIYKESIQHWFYQYM